MYRHRFLSDRLKRLFSAFPVVVVSGARQVGKTTLLRHVFPELDYVVFDASLDREDARREPDLFLRNHSSPVILDEIQYAPELVSAIKRHVDAAGSAPGQFLLTGSQQWQVLRSMSESLAGRVAFLDLESFCLAEAEGAAGGWLAAWLESPTNFLEWSRGKARLSTTGLQEWLWRGSLPKAVEIEADLIPDFCSGYHRTYVERDARVAGEINDWQQFGQFVRLMAALTAQEINFSQLGREIGMTPQTARRWLRVMEATFQWIELPAFSGNPVKRVSQRPKGHFADTGLACHHAMLSSPKTLGGHPLFGALFETAVVAEIRKQAALLPGRGSFHHWRSAGGAEVDLLLERDGIHHPFEIKLTANPGRRDAAGLQAFRQAHPDRMIGVGALVCAIEQPRWIAEDVMAIPWNLLNAGPVPAIPP